MMLLKGTRIAILAVIGLLSSTLSLGAPLPQIEDPSGLASGIGEDPRGHYSAIFKVLTPAQVSGDFLMRIARSAYMEMRKVHDRWTEDGAEARGLEIPQVMAIMDMGDNVIYAASSVKFPRERSGASIQAYRALQGGLCGEVNLLCLDADMQKSQGATTYYQPGENTRMVAWNGNENEAIKFYASRGPKEFGCENINEHYSRELTRAQKRI
ncbi:hypothetical protein GGTG_01749 [Gaeumannomyces tritici R3-111a-1]|uniref:Uncharacterized protein n=1 Tax=Gaeumannomyces tritici (strain R3-111a-1) TaxID=644352 RepID=J3NKG0_GAET3|nr:hypothetical protein GGTG_01749 [Gaeumannomyces tritici R3-111a-1]EJT81774.1 hypothetical protein GGTG_01749 [Gaeumannomyces tritici R3-111a-1]